MLRQTRIPFGAISCSFCRWVNLGLLAVENIRGAQAYNIPSPVELRYLSLQMHGSYGKETFCTMSGVQVYFLLWSFRAFLIVKCAGFRKGCNGNY
jgi:hypothetical protein